MQIITDLQLHSKYSRAVSPKMDLFEISCWAAKKGINIVATGDWTHPLWFRQIKTDLEEASPGLFTLKQKPENQKRDVYFFLSTEISSIYVQGGRQRRIHNLIFSPSIETCEAIIKEFQKRGANLMADGRPIVGISSKDLLEMVLSIDENVLFVPAHVWTPWYSLFGSKSGFDSIKECFGSLERYIYAIETGLSSDPIMNWQIKELETRSIVSFSDAHSGPKLGREATVFAENKKLKIKNEKFDYFDIIGAIKRDTKSRLEIAYTIEFFPEEGKYHYTGHRDCGVKLSPDQVEKQGATCPVCGRQLTIGVDNRVRKLSTKVIKEEDLIFKKSKAGVTFVIDKGKKRKSFVSLVPLLEILQEAGGLSQAKALIEYEQLVDLLGSEFEILLKLPDEEIESKAGHRLSQAIKIVRERKVYVDPGFDGVFGQVKIFPDQKESIDKDDKHEKEQQSLF